MAAWRLSYAPAACSGKSYRGYGWSIERRFVCCQRQHQQPHLFVRRLAAPKPSNEHTGV
jgi:hypothetical protein